MWCFVCPLIPSLNKCFLFTFTAVLFILCHGQCTGTLNGSWPEIPDGLLEGKGQQTVELLEATLLVLTGSKNGHPEVTIRRLLPPHSFSQGGTLGEHSDL